MHCSAGIGRSGVFIVVHSQLERLRQELQMDTRADPSICVFDEIVNIRNQRAGAIEREVTKDKTFCGCNFKF